MNITPDEPATQLAWAIFFAESDFPVLVLHSIEPIVRCEVCGITPRPVSVKRHDCPHAVIAEGCSCLDRRCASAGKHPRVKGGAASATTDLTVIVEWFRRWPFANIGLATGITFDALDVDDRHLSDVWFPKALHLDDEGPVPTSATPDGGHFIFQPVGIRRAAVAGMRAEWLGEGHYIVVPPANVLSRPTGGQRGYSWSRQGWPFLFKPAPAPKWLIDLLTKQPPTTPESPIGLEDVASDEHRAAPSNSRETRRYALGALRRAAERLAATPEGNRNNTLNDEAFALTRFVVAGLLTIDELVETLRSAALASGLEQPEIDRTIHSGVEGWKRRNG